MTRALAIVYRTIATHVISKAGFTKPMAQTGAVTLVQRFSHDVWFTCKQKVEREVPPGT